MTKLLVTGATGQLGRHVLDALAGRADKPDIAVLVRTPEAQAAFAAQGYDARLGSYDDRATLDAALDGIDRVLLISGSEIGQRLPQHRNVIDAARTAGVAQVVYTSILNAADSPMALAAEHRATEEALVASGLEHVILRNGWYTENHLMGVPQALEMGKVFGAAGEGRFSTATRRDYAEAAAAVLTGEGHGGKVYELGGDDSYTLSEFAAALGELSGKKIVYVDLPETGFAEALAGAGLPEAFAGILADSDARAAEGWLQTDRRDLSALIGRRTTPLRQALAEAL